MAEVIDELDFRNKLYVFENRFQAGELLHEKLKEFKRKQDAYLFAIPAGGIQVAVKISEALEIPLDVLVTRKLHIPWNKEAGFGAISWNGLIFFNESLMASLRLSKEQIERCVAEEKNEIDRRLKLFRDDQPFPDLKDKTAIVVDDGLASGFSMLTTLKALSDYDLKKTIVAVPTASMSAIHLVKPHADRIICLNIRFGPVFAVAAAYREWYDLTDDEVVKILRKN